MTITDGNETAPERGLSFTQRADLLSARENWAGGEPEIRTAPDGSKRRVAGDAVRVPQEGIIRVLSSKGLTMPEHVRAKLAQMTVEEMNAHCDELEQRTEAEALAAAAEARRANRYASYLRRRNPKYADATYEMLRPDQLAGGRIARWWGSPRRPRSLLLAGRSRTGKTTVGYAIANHAHTDGEWVEVFTAPALVKDLRDPDKSGPTWDRVIGCGLLYLDDLGRERVTDWWKELLQEILDSRIARAAQGQRLLVTANTPADETQAYAELVDRYGDPIVERIIDGGGIVMFDGPAMRNLVTDW